MNKQQELAEKKGIMTGILELIDGKCTNIIMPSMFASLDYIAGHLLEKSKDKKELDANFDSITLAILTISDNMSDLYHQRRGELHDE